MHDYEDYETPKPLSEFDSAIEGLKRQITEAIKEGEGELARRKTNTLEKLLKIQKQAPESLDPVEALRRRRAEKDALMEELNRKLDRLRGDS